MRSSVDERREAEIGAQLDRHSGELEQSEGLRPCCLDGLVRGPTQVSPVDESPASDIFGQDDRD
jgi:hypothetical protein